MMGAQIGLGGGGDELMMVVAEAKVRPCGFVV
jgi:hypothetical protein